MEATTEVEVEQVTTQNLPDDPAEAVPEVAEPEPVQQDEPEADPKEDEHQATIRRMERRIQKLTATKYQTAAAADQARREAEELRQRLSQYETGEQQQGQIRPEDVLVLADRIAEAKREREQVVGKVQSVLREGKALDGFDAACNAVNAEIPFYSEKGEPSAFLRVVLESDAPAKVLHYLGTHLDEADEIAGMTPTQAARRLARLEDQLSRAPDPVPQTSAPRPIAPVASQGGSGLSKDPAQMTDREFAEWRKRQIAQRR